MNLLSKSKKAEGLPIYAIAIVVIGVVALALILIFLFSSSQKSTGQIEDLFAVEENVTKQGQETAQNYRGGIFQASSKNIIISSV